MSEPRRPLFQHQHKKRPVGLWLALLVIVLVVIFVVPKLLD